MAEGGGHETERHSYRSLESDFVFDFYCEFCKDDGKNVEAEGFCVDCDEYLCEVCYNAHTRNRQTRYHQLLDKDKMPKDTPLSSNRISKDISTRCKLHTGEIVKYYCKTHDVLGCSSCFVTDHGRCPDVEEILKKSKNILDSKEYTEFMETLNYLDKSSRDTIAKARANITETKNCHSEVIKAVKLLKEEVNRILDKLEQDIVTEVDTIVSEEEDKMAAISNNCSTVTESIEKLIVEFKRLQSSRRVCQIYVSMKERCEHIKALQDKIRQTEDTLALRTFQFDANRKFQDFIKDMPTLGKISSRVPGTEAIDLAPMKIIHVDDIPVYFSEFPSGIVGFVLISNTRLVTVHMVCVDGLLLMNEFKAVVTLLDAQTNKPISELSVSGPPYDITVIGNNKAALTRARSRNILLLNISKELNIDREIAVDGECRGITFSKDRLLVSYTDPPKLEIMDLSGRVMKTISNSKGGNQLFQCPEYVCVSKNGEIIYVSDSASKKVTSLTFDGVVKSVYTDPKLECPKGLCVDHHGNVYVSCDKSNNVHMLTADLTKINIILTEIDGLSIFVRSLYHCQETDRLYVAMQYGLKVFQLSYNTTL